MRSRRPWEAGFPLGRNVTAASAHLMPDGGMMVAYVDGGDDMEKVFNVSHD